MNKQVRVVFAGLIALAMDSIPTRSTIRVETSDPVSAYLLRAEGHVPVLLIPRDDVDSPEGMGACAPDDAIDTSLQCAMLSDVGGWTPGPCEDDSYDHYLWCLRGLQIEVEQTSTSTARYLNGSRPGGGPDRHLRFRKPSEIAPSSGIYYFDVSWVPEMKKVVGIAKLSRNFNQHMASAMEDLRGLVTPYFWNEESWDWFEVRDDGYYPTDGRKYDQAFAHKVEVSIELRSPYVKLVRRPDGKRDDFTITLSSESTSMYVYNLPKEGDLEDTIVNDERVCVARHFTHYFDVLEEPPEKARVPYFKPEGATCETYTTFTALSRTPLDVKGENATDSFCPPVIVKPGG